MSEPEFRLNTATAADIERHLAACDARFVPPLSSRVRLGEYAVKLALRATRFEAWADDALVGLVALYCNDTDTCVAHVSNVSVASDWHGRGVASNLLARSLRHARDLGMLTIRLEVGDANRVAIGLYEKFGFRVVGSNASSATMSRNLDDHGDRHVKRA